MGGIAGVGRVGARARARAARPARSAPAARPRTRVGLRRAKPAAAAPAAGLTAIVLIAAGPAGRCGLGKVHDQVEHVDQRHEQRHARRWPGCRAPGSSRGVAAQARPVEDRLDQERVDERVGEHQRDHRTTGFSAGRSARAGSRVAEAERRAIRTWSSPALDQRRAGHLGDHAGRVGATTSAGSTRCERVLVRTGQLPVMSASTTGMWRSGERARVVELGVVLAGRREPAEPLGEHVLQDQRQPEDRHRDAEHRDDPHQHVGQPAVAAGRDQPERQPDDQREQQPGADQLERGG